MITRNLTVIIISITMFTLTARSQNIDKWHDGSAKQLNGISLSLICFISTPNNPWPTEMKKEIIYSIEESNNWIQNQAKNYNVNLSMKYKYLNDSEDILFDTIESGFASGDERVDWIYRTMKKLDYKNSRQAYRKLSRKYNSKNIQVIVIANSVGRPYSMRYAKGFSKKKYFLEGVIIFNKYLNDAPMPVASTLTHEILHIYGAWDLYKTYAQTSQRQEKARELYPNDIMLRVDHNINTLQIDKLTAWLIGWNQDQEEIFEWFRPADYKK